MYSVSGYVRTRHHLQLAEYVTTGTQTNKCAGPYACQYWTICTTFVGPYRPFNLVDARVWRKCAPCVFVLLFRLPSPTLAVAHDALVPKGA
eukprot:2547695-Rhodomonas_salina.1